MEMTNAENVRKFIFGGNAIFTAVSNQTQKRYTYRVRKDKNNDVWYVSTMFTSDNNVYVYIGFIKNGEFIPSDKKLSKNDVRTISFNWIFNKIVQRGIIPPELSVFHEGKCARCARRLTVPESIETGFGPECKNRMICD